MPHCTSWSNSSVSSNFKFSKKNSLNLKYYYTRITQSWVTSVLYNSYITLPVPARYERAYSNQTNWLRASSTNKKFKESESACAVRYNALDLQNTVGRSYLTDTVVEYDVDCTVLRTHSCDTEAKSPVTLPYCTWSVSTIALRLKRQAVIIYTRVVLRYFSLYFDWADFHLN